MVLMEDGSLSHSPLSMSILHRGVLWKNSGQVPIIQVRHVYQCLCMIFVIVQDKGSLMSKPSGQSSDNEVGDIEVGDPSSDVEVLNGKLSNNEEAKHSSYLGSCGVVSPVKIRLVSGSRNYLIHPVSSEPTGQLSEKN